MPWLDAAVPDPHAGQGVFYSVVRGEVGWNVENHIARPFVAADMGDHTEIDVDSLQFSVGGS